MPFSEMEKAGREAGMQRKIKHVKEMYAKNYKMLMKEIKEDLNKWKDILCSQTEDSIQ